MDYIETAPPEQQAAPPAPVAGLGEPLEKLRAQAERETADKRKPAWAPALILGDNIVAALTALQCPLPDKPVARLWATFDSDKTIRAFTLCLGVGRSGDTLLRAYRRAPDTWQVSTFFGWRGAQPPTMPLSSWNDLRYLREDVKRMREARDERILERLPEAEAQLARAEQICAAFQAERAACEQKQARLRELVLQRIAEFARDPLPEMIAAAQLTVRCAICGRQLTDPQSVARGIGPECYSHGSVR